MAEIKVTQENYVDYSAVRFFAARNVENLKMSIKQVTLKSTGEIVPLIHLEGVSNETGEIVNFDVWPRNVATKEDLAKLPKTVNEFYFRIGYATVLGETRQSAPKWLVINPGDSDELRLSGDKREYTE